jgi:hypothetical protein
MNLIEDWHRVAPKLWSVRLALVAAIASMAETGMNLYATGTAPPLVVASCIVSLGAAVARIVAQPGVGGNG